VSRQAKVLGDKGATFKYPGTEVYAPNQHNILRPVAENRITSRRTDSVRISATRMAGGQRGVVIEFPKVGYAYMITTVSELERFQASFGAMLDQLRRPGLEEL
jgi:hypothetical protein